MATIKYKGVRIVPVKITRYEVRDATGHLLRKTSTPALARAWIDGHHTASERVLKEAAAVAARKPKRTRKPKVLDTPAE